LIGVGIACTAGSCAEFRNHHRLRRRTGCMRPRGPRPM